MSNQIFQWIYNKLNHKELLEMCMESLYFIFQNDVREYVKNIVCTCCIDSFLSCEQRERAIKWFETTVDAIHLSLRIQTHLYCLQFSCRTVPHRFLHFIYLHSEMHKFKPLEILETSEEFYFLFWLTFVLCEYLLVESEHNEVYDFC